MDTKEKIKNATNAIILQEVHDKLGTHRNLIIESTMKYRYICNVLPLISDKYTSGEVGKKELEELGLLDKGVIEELERTNTVMFYFAGGTEQFNYLRPQGCGLPSVMGSGYLDIKKKHIKIAIKHLKNKMS